MEPSKNLSENKEDKPKSDSTNSTTKPEETKLAAKSLNTQPEETKKVDVYRPPDPSRFEIYTMLEDQSGFTIEGTDFIFKLDEHGGWFDEYGNYYNADGEPEEDEEGYEKKGGGADWGYDLDGYEDGNYDPAFEDYDSVVANEENMRRLGQYFDDDPIVVQFSNISFKTPMKAFFDYLLKANIQFYNPKFELFGTSGHKGTCSVTCETKKSAEKAVDCNGKKFEGRNLRVVVRKLEDVGLDDEK